MLGNNSGHLEEQHALLTTEPFLQPQGILGFRLSFAFVRLYTQSRYYSGLPRTSKQMQKTCNCFPDCEGCWVSGGNNEKTHEQVSWHCDKPREKRKEQVFTEPTVQKLPEGGAWEPDPAGRICCCVQSRTTAQQEGAERSLLHCCTGMPEGGEG